MEGMWPRMYNLTERSVLAKGQTDRPGISLVSRQPCSRIHREFSSMCVLERRVHHTENKGSDSAIYWLCYFRRVTEPLYASLFV